MHTLLAIGMPGLPEMIIILVIIVMLFGVGKLPKVLGQMGKSVKAFKKGMGEGEEDEDLREIDVTETASARRSGVTEAEEVNG